MSEAERDRLEAETLELAALRLERLSGSEVYRSAFRKAAREIRKLKPECRKINGFCNDAAEQISS